MSGRGALRVAAGCCGSLLPRRLLPLRLPRSPPPATLTPAAAAGIAGYVSAALYKVMGGTNWVRNVLVTTMLFCGPLLGTFSFLNTVAIFYGVSRARPAGEGRRAAVAAAPPRPACPRGPTRSRAVLPC